MIEFLEALLDALIDTLKVFPFIFAVFILIAFFESRVTEAKLKNALGGKFAPLIGSVTGVVPQCGFSVMGAKLFHERCITAGTLLAIFISTSDEGVVVLLTGGKWKEFLLLTAVKIIAAVIAGYAAGAFIKPQPGEETPSDGAAEYGHCHHHGENESKWHEYFVHPLLHTLKTAAFVLAVNVVFGIIIYLVGEGNFEKFMSGTAYLQPFVAGLVGLIPNCAPSVVIAQTFTGGGLTFGGLTAGLIANAGVGLAVVFRGKGKLREKFAVIAALYFTAVTVGEIAVLIGAFI